MKVPAPFVEYNMFMNSVDAMDQVLDIPCHIEIMDVNNAYALYTSVWSKHPKSTVSPLISRDDGKHSIAWNLSNVTFHYVLEPLLEGLDTRTILVIHS